MVFLEIVRDMNEEGANIETSGKAEDPSLEYLRISNLRNWARSVSLSGERTTMAASTWSTVYRATVGSLQEDEDLNIELEHLDFTLQFEIKCFVMATHNYYKALNRTKRFLPNPPPIPIDSKLLTALRNIKEHWENFEGRIFADQISDQRARKNLKAFAEKFPNSPGLPHMFSIDEQFHCIIGGFLDISLMQNHANDILEIIDTNFREFFY
jgi:hypothetical protein